MEWCACVCLAVNHGPTQFAGRFYLLYEENDTSDRKSDDSLQEAHSLLNKIETFTIIYIYSC